MYEPQDLVGNTKTSYYRELSFFAFIGFSCQNYFTVVFVLGRNIFG
jgi:hypothetical protein